MENKYSFSIVNYLNYFLIPFRPFFKSEQVNKIFKVFFNFFLSFDGSVKG